jgi:hypothetical protein
MTIVIYALSFGAAASISMIALGWAAGKFIAALE